MEKINFITDDGSEELYVIADTTVAGESFLLVTDTEEGDADAWILKQIKTEDDEVIYEDVMDDKQLEALSKVFAEILEDVEFS